MAVSERLRVLVVTPDFPPEKGGIQLLLSRVVENAPALECRVLTLGQPAAEQFDAAFPADVRRIGTADGRRAVEALKLNALSMTEARRFGPDVILSGHVVGGLGALALQRALRVPLVQYVHADEFRVRAGLTAAIVRRAQATIAVSTYTRQMALDVGADPRKVTVIPPGIDLPATPSGERDPRPTLLTVATLLFRYKGHDVLARALPLVRAKVPAARWVVVGEGPFRPALQNAVNAYGIQDCVELLGRVEDDERDRLLDRSSVFCMPSRVPAGGVGGEGFGIAYMEAAAHGLPTIGGDVAGARDAVLNGETGLLIDPVDHLALAEAATELLLDRERAAAMGAAGRLHAERHAWPCIAGRVEALLREVASRQR